MSTVQIINAKIVDSDYEHEFHLLWDQKDKNGLKLILLIPGIRPETIDFRIENFEIQLKAGIKKDYFLVYRAKILTLRGKLPVKTNPKVFTIKYDEGMVNINLLLL